MKKNLFALALTIVLFNTAFAENPQIRTCRLNHAQFWTLDIVQPQTDNIGFCKWGQSMMGSISMMEYSFENTQTQAVQAFFQTQTTKFMSCSSAGAKTIKGMDSTDRAYSLCLFADDSFIEKKTLTRGWSHPQNRAMVQNL